MTEKVKSEARGSVGFSVLQVAHARMVFGRRVRVLADILSARIPQGSAVLDIGCGDGTIGNLLAEQGSEISIEGVEFAPRPQCRIRCRAFDGAKLPFPDWTFDVCLFVDVLHHTDDPTILLREARRVAT
jgi:ubiquinone/menaquinone biosynthesis C-methylase UbiE